MSGIRLFDRDEYVPDPVDYEIREIRDLIDQDSRKYQEDDDLDTLSTIYQHDCIALADVLLGAYSNYDCDFDLSEEQLKILDEKYSHQGSEINDYGEIVERDPLIGWVPKSSLLEEVLFEAGHVLGMKNDLGQYYRLLVDDNFARGVWLGRLENAVSVSDMDTLKDVRAEMQLLRPETYQEDFNLIMGSLFTVVTDNGYVSPKGLK